MLDTILSYTIYQDTTIGDLMSVDALISLGGSVLGALLMLLAGLVVSRAVSRRVRGIGLRYQALDVTLFNFLSNIARYLILVLTVMFVLNTFGIQTTSIVALIGAGGLAIGLALQGTLSNVAAGVMIVFFRPFKIGDFVDIAGTAGTVKDITLNFTELADLSNVQIIVPNAQAWGNIITNYSTNDTRRAEWVFGVSYGANLKAAEKAIRDTIMADPRSMADPEPFIQVNNLGDFSVDFLVRVWVPSSEYFQYQADMKRNVKEALDATGIEIPFPTRTVFNTAE
ncbi:MULTISPECIES: mechanosensitive ion channel family protein [Pacificibacter]|uniref:mechanosensitive ion channel family protein n=1 Tax=Pacificibacter TaxID=1042323 RepID=UPI001C097453|nr:MULTISPECIES: mechanosensitive ion channel family protein [Pacificibacter]MBU2937311.1 mechanosensitive ion channel family protein [Pacificibacter marinus]MDO6615306.1 mechanosensitive ion channel family protein [Pacificibacter sp. 1_MG-2023]